MVSLDFFFTTKSAMSTQDRGVRLGGPCCRAVVCFVGLARFFCDDYSAGRRIVVAGRDLSPSMIMTLSRWGVRICHVNFEHEGGAGDFWRLEVRGCVEVSNNQSA